MKERSETWTRGEGEDLCYYATSSLTTFKEERARARKGQLGRGKGKQPRGIPTGCGWHLSLKFSPTAGRGKLAAPMHSVMSLFPVKKDVMVEMTFPNVMNYSPHSK